MSPITTRTPLCIDTIEQAREYPLADFPSRKNPDAILMCEPTYFEIRDVKNQFMEGHVADLDKTLAVKQWNDLKAAFEKVGRPVKVLSPQPDLEDMVFTANQLTVDESADGVRQVILSRMTHPSRQLEVPFFAQWFKDRGYKIVELQDSDELPLRFEGHGDCVWHPGKRLLWGGYGARSERQAYDILSRLLQTTVVRLPLVDPKFYHLDTAFCAVSQDTVVIYPGAFEPRTLELVRFYFKNVIEVSEKEANNFVCNGVGVGNKFVVQRGSGETCAKLLSLGIEPVEVDTSEFMKSGGSAFCLKTEFFS